MVELGGNPVLWHIMKIYSAHGLNDFIICAPACRLSPCRSTCRKTPVPSRCAQCITRQTRMARSRSCNASGGGCVFDVADDLRAALPGNRRWFGIELAPELRRMLYIPQGCAQGVMTLEDDSDVLYLVGHCLRAFGAARGAMERSGFCHCLAGAPLVMSARDETRPDSNHERVRLNVADAWSMTATSRVRNQRVILDDAHAPARFDLHSDL